MGENQGLDKGDGGEGGAGYPVKVSRMIGEREELNTKVSGEGGAGCR